jgi:hypothetical protein
VSQATEAGDEGGADQWALATDRYRDVAKWLVAAFGAMGAVIAGTAPLSVFGHLGPDRGGYVAGGAAAAVAGVSLVLVASVAVLVPRAVFGHQLVAHERSWPRRALSSLGRFEDLLARHPQELLPARVASVGQLSQAIANLGRSSLALSQHAATLDENDPARGQAERAAQAMAATRARHQRALHELLSLAGYLAARARFNQAMVVVMAGGLVTAAGVGLVLYGTTGTPG